MKSNTILENEVGKSLKLIRLKQSCSQAEFCRRLNISNGTYSAWETGRFLPSLSSFENVLIALERIGVSKGVLADLRRKYIKAKAENK